jgi:hypothetical protein
VWPADRQVAAEVVLMLVVRCNLVVSAILDLIEVATAAALVAAPTAGLLVLDYCNPVNLLVLVAVPIAGLLALVAVSTAGLLVLVAAPIAGLLVLDYCNPVAVALAAVRTYYPTVAPFHTIDPMQGVDLLHRRLLHHNLLQDGQPVTKVMLVEMTLYHT